MSFAFEMEVYNPSKLSSPAYATVFNQTGNGRVSMDRYVYDQSGEGIGAVLGNLVKLAIPLAGPIIDGIKSLIKKKPNTNLKSTAKQIAQSDEFNQFTSDAATYLKPIAKKAIKAGMKRAHKHISGNRHRHISSGVAKKRSYRKRLRR